MSKAELLTDDQWSVLEPLFQEERTGAGRPTCYRRFSKWVKDGRLRKILESLARHLEEKGLINLGECFIDGTFVVAKKGLKSWKDQAGQRYEAHGYC